MRTGQILLNINSELGCPLNELLWIADLKRYGKLSYVYLDPEKLIKLAGNANALRDPIAVQFLVSVLSSVIDSGGHVGKFFASIIPSSDPVFDGLPTITDVVNSNAAMTIIVNSTLAMNAVANSALAMTAIANSAIAIGILDNANPITVPKMVSNTAPYGEAIAKNVSTGTYAYKAFDKLNIDQHTTAWLDSFIPGNYVGYKFTTPVVAYRAEYSRTAYEVTASTARIPTTFKFQYSDDGVNWFDASDIYTAKPFEYGIGAQNYILNKSVGRHLYWNISILTTASAAPTVSAIGEVQFYGF